VLYRRVGLASWLSAVWRLTEGRSLMERAQAPEVATLRERRFDALYARCEQAIYAYLWRVTGDRQVASDLCQETFLRAWQHIGKIESYAQPEGWLFRVATNLALNDRRHRATVGAHLSLREEYGPSASDPARWVAEHDAVHAALLALPTHLRAALIMREVHGLSFDEVAQALGTTHAAAKMTLTRAREQFRRIYLGEEGRQ
jgi:RNA polymerase sigma-70 factor (ECF subfamily)